MFTGSTWTMSKHLTTIFESVGLRKGAPGLPAEKAFGMVRKNYFLLVQMAGQKHMARYLSTRQVNLKEKIGKKNARVSWNCSSNRITQMYFNIATTLQLLRGAM